MIEKKPTKDNPVFLDSNVMLYAYSFSEKEKQQVSRQIISKNHTVISTQVLQEIGNTLNRKFKLDYDTVKEALKECIHDSNEIHTNKPQTVF